jgi:hypothetical protein
LPFSFSTASVKAGIMWKKVLLLSSLILPLWAEEEGVWSLTTENDTYGAGTDKDYTNGIRLSHLETEGDVPDLAYRVADIFPLFEAGRRSALMYSLGHNLYTPRDTTRPIPDPTDRPYAALLYGSIGLASANETLTRVDELELLAGVIGPLALGREIQQMVHEWLSTTKPRGWGSQLKNEPVFTLTWQRRWPRALAADLGFLRLSVTPHVALALGNAQTYGAVGGTVGLSPKGAPLQDQPLRVRPALPGTGYFENVSRFNWQLFAGAEARAVARDIFLDGNTFVDSPSVNKKPLVSDVQAGLAFTYKNVRLAYTAVYRTKEFYGQDDANLFGAISLSFRY